MFPPTIRRLDPDVHAPAWTAEHRAQIDGVLRQHGALLLRGFGITGADTFEAVAGTLVKDLYGEYGDLPHEKDTGRVYKSTPYPATLPILFHHESAHMPHWPSRQFFCCIQPSREGGATPIADGRKVYAALPEDLRNRFESLGVRYVRNFIEGLDVGWSQLYGSADRAEVENRCRAEGIECEWLPNGTLRTQQWAPAVIRHPHTGEPVFFNQILLHHPACLDPTVHDSLRSLLGDDQNAFPRNVSYGDSQPIEPAAIALIRSRYDALAHRFPWQAGDIAILDNMLISHARDPFTGPRKILVTMGDMTSRQDVTSADTAVPPDKPHHRTASTA